MAGVILVLIGVILGVMFSAISPWLALILIVAFGAVGLLVTWTELS